MGWYTRTAGAAVESDVASHRHQIHGWTLSQNDLSKTTCHHSTSVSVTVKHTIHEKNDTTFIKHFWKSCEYSTLISPARESSREQIIRAFAVIFAKNEWEQTRAAVYSPDRRTVRLKQRGGAHIQSCFLSGEHLAHSFKIRFYSLSNVVIKCDFYDY